MNNYPATLLCDFYKVSHREQYPQGTEYIYSTWTPRSNKFLPRADKVVSFGIQSFIKKYLIEYFNVNFFDRDKIDVLKEYVRVIRNTLGVKYPKSEHIAELWDLGYLPIKIKALPEGTLVPIRVPMMTIENTDPKFFWITNYLETIISSEIWQPMTSATIAYEYRKILDKYAFETVGNNEHVNFQAHDFSMRGMAGLDSAASSGAGHLLSFTGTDTIPAILFHEKYYNANIEEELVGASIPATEHSVMCANGTDELEVYKRFINEVYPNGFVSIVSDTWDFWGIIKDIIPQLKEDILKRDGRVVIRPDSGDPVDIICGEYIKDLTDVQYVDSLEDAKDYMHDILKEKMRDETPHGECGEDDNYVRFKYEDKYYIIEVEYEWDRHDRQYYYIDGSEISNFEEVAPTLSQLGLIEALWNIFGGTINEKGYKMLDSHIGAIYGDSITLERCEEICSRLKEKGFASSNIVFGVGSYTYQYNTRDTFGFAMKATWAQINGEEKLLYKDPKTDSGMKKSQKGRVIVLSDAIGDLYYEDNLNFEQWEEMQNHDEMLPVFINGKLINEQSLSCIRKKLLENN